MEMAHPDLTRCAFFLFSSIISQLHPHRYLQQIPNNKEQRPGNKNTQRITPSIFEQRAIRYLLIILPHISQHQRHIEHKRCNGICRAISNAESTLSYIRRNTHLREHRNKDKRHESPFGSGGHHYEIDRSRK